MFYSVKVIDMAYFFSVELIYLNVWMVSSDGSTTT